MCWLIDRPRREASPIMKKLGHRVEGINGSEENNRRDVLNGNKYLELTDYDAIE